MEREVIFVKKLLMLLLALLCVANAYALERDYSIDAGNSDRVHLRQAPSQAAESLGLYFTGTDVTVVEWYDEWAQVEIGNEAGYVMSRVLTSASIASAGPRKIVKNLNSTWVNLRLFPAMDGEILLRLDNGTSLRILGETADGWSYVEYQEIKGYMRTEMLSAPEKNDVEASTTILTAAGWDSYIHQYVAQNGQVLYFTAELVEPHIYLDDVNFDGWDDLVVMTMTSAKSTAYQFFVYDAKQDEYVYVRHTDYGGGLINYTTYPRYGLIETHATNGNAGLLHVTNLYRWEGNALKLIRSAVSDEWEESSFVGETYTSIVHGDILHVTVRDHTRGYEDAVIYERIIPMDDADHHRIYEEEMAALWQGLK